MIILPAIDIRDGKCVRLLQGDYDKETIYADNPVTQAKKWENEGGEIIHLVDLDGAKEGFSVNLSIIKNICNTVNIPCELGGGIRSIQNIKDMLDAGVSRVILGTIALKNPAIVKKAIEKFGAEKIVVGIDAKDGMVAINGWRETTNTKALSIAKEFVAMGLERIIYTDIATDGMMQGPNFAEIATLCDTVPSCKIIASGGVSSVENVIKLKELNKVNLEGAIVGKALYDGSVSLEELLK